MYLFIFSFLFLAILITSRPIVHCFFSVMIYGCSCFLFFFNTPILCSKGAALGKITRCPYLRASYFSCSLIQGSVCIEEKKSSLKDAAFVIKRFPTHTRAFSISLPCIFTSGSFISPPPTLFPTHLFCFVFLSPFRFFLRAASICTRLFR